ncbi:PP2C family protein-serine/threonine phosphatase [Streptomyces sp. NPDC091272]|uniref:PP2C family protein-serine/threonine phosphatase n=1 Tax=Streptomyces sp. NPDC091272 TaxID=3365981 RepID=UPI0037F56B5B
MISQRAGLRRRAGHRTGTARRTGAIRRPWTRRRARRTARPARYALGAALLGLWFAAVVGFELARPLPDLVTCSCFVLAAVLLAVGIRLGPLRELRRLEEVARAVQEVVLRPLPARLEGLALAAGQLSASPGAVVGGDLYEVMATVHGVRVVIGDVRGHGLPAIGAVAALLGSFREAAHDERELGGVLRRLERALQRHLDERARDGHPARGMSQADDPLLEEFVTVLLLEIHEDGEVLALNCGHPWPYRVRTGAETVRGADPLPPLGPFPLPPELHPTRCVTLRPGELLVLHTDGAQDARNADGEFFPLRDALTGAAAEPSASPSAVVERVQRALLRHTGGRVSDDVALVVLRNDRPRVPVQGAASFLHRAEPSRH